MNKEQINRELNHICDNLKPPLSADELLRRGECSDTVSAHLEASNRRRAIERGNELSAKAKTLLAHQ